MISTKGRYALRAVIDLAEHSDGGLTPMKEVAKRQEISLKYLERILPTLTSAGIIEGAHGRNGGYRLAKAPRDIRVLDILRLTEGDISPVGCDGSCARSADCRTYPMWAEYIKMTESYFGGISVADLMKTDR